MMQDYPKLLSSEAKVGFISLEREVCFSAVKNNAVDALGKQKKTGFPESACSGEADAYKINRRYLSLAGASVDVEGKDAEFNRIKTKVGAKLVFQPSFACTLAELKSKFPKPEQVKIGNDATIVLEGAGVTVESLEMQKGFLSITACPGAEVVVNWKEPGTDGPTMDFEPVGEWAKATNSFKYPQDLPEKYQIRGYTTKFSGTADERSKRTFVFDKPGKYVVSI